MLQDTTASFVRQILNTPRVELDICDETHNVHEQPVDLPAEGQQKSRKGKLKFRILLAPSALRLLDPVNTYELGVQLVLVENVTSKLSVIVFLYEYNVFIIVLELLFASMLCSRKKMINGRLGTHQDYIQRLFSFRRQRLRCGRTT